MVEREKKFFWSEAGDFGGSFGRVFGTFRSVFGDFGGDFGGDGDPPAGSLFRGGTLGEG